MRNDVSVMVLLAATSGKADIIEHLLSSYCDLIDVNIQYKVKTLIFMLLLLLICIQDGQTPLYQAGKKGSLESVKLLLSHPNINAIINSEVSRLFLFFYFCVNSLSILVSAISRVISRCF